MIQRLRKQTYHAPIGSISRATSLRYITAA